ncbi:MAG: tetraacyldisaccharide 4'-kinase [Desulfobacteraceae bacterium]|nr:tetraacyldisaccharide 4'-kinase [Desulfobacteraceae bacterium]
MHTDTVRDDRILAGLLYWASRVYGGAVRLRNFCFRNGVFQTRALPCRVISVGNITVGGTGKTPMAIYMAKLIQQMGYRPAVLSRGYKGGAEKDGAVVSDGRNLLADFQTAGDEPLLMACRLNGVPVLVGGNRYKSGMRAVAEFDPDMIILDDGFQHRAIYRDLDLVLMDARQGAGNGFLLPRGVLREPVSGLGRAHALVATRVNQAPDFAGAVDAAPGIPVFRANHDPYVAGIYPGNDDSAVSASGLSESYDFSLMENRRIFAFSGIAQNLEFRDMLECRLGKLSGFSGFADHHSYTQKDLQAIVEASRKSSCELLATTDKDFVRIAGRLPASVSVAVIGVHLVFTDTQEEDRFAGFVREKLAGRIREVRQ